MMSASDQNPPDPKGSAASMIQQFVSVIGFLALSSTSGVLFVTAFCWLGASHVALRILTGDPNLDLDVPTLVLFGIPGSLVLFGCSIGFARLAGAAAVLGARPLELTGRTVHLIPQPRLLARQSAVADAALYVRLSPFILAALAYATGWGLDRQGRGLTRIDVHPELAAPLAVLVLAILLAAYSFFRYCRPLLRAEPNSCDAVASGPVVPCIRKESAARLFGWPLVSIRFGPDPEAGERWGHAKGIIALGNSAVGVIAVGNFALGVFAAGVGAAGFVSFGPLAFGVLLAYGAAALGTGVALGALAGGLVAAGALSIGFVAAGSGAIGYYAFGVRAIGVHVLDHIREDPTAIDFVDKWLR